MEGLAVDILASDHYKLHIVIEEPLAMAVLRRQAAGIPDIQAEVAHKEALCELAGSHSLYSHPQNNLTCKKWGKKWLLADIKQNWPTSQLFSQK